MKILITMKGGSSGIEGEYSGTMKEILELLETGDKFIFIDKTPYGEAIVNKSNIGYITKKI